MEEKPYRRSGSNEDGNFLILKLSGDKQVTVAHRQLNKFGDAPPGVLKLMERLNLLLLLLEEERIPLEKTSPSAKAIR